MMHPAPQTTAVKVDGQAGALGAAAALLGFNPTDSVVVMCLSGPRRQIGPVIRVDLDHGQIPAGSAEQLAAHAARHADEVIVMTFTDTGAAAAPDTAALVAALRPACTVLEVIDAANTPHEVPEQLLVATALSGRAVLPDRAALARSVAHTPTTHPADPMILSAMDNVTGRDQWLTTHGSDPASLPALVAAVQATRDTDPHPEHVRSPGRHRLPQRGRSAGPGRPGPGAGQRPGPPPGPANARRHGRRSAPVRPGRPAPPVARRWWAGSF